MTKFVVIASGKGGTGKTTTAINLGTALSDFGRDVIVVDANITTPNVGLHLGMHSTQLTLHDALKGKKHIKEVVYSHPSGLKIIPAHISLDESKGIKKEKLADVIMGLAGATDIVIIDTATGFGDEMQNLIKSSDEMLIVTTPELAAITDALKTIKLAEENDASVIGIVLNRYSEEDIDMTVENIEKMLGKKILAVIPEDKHIKKSIKLKHPVIYAYPMSPSSVGFKKLAARLIGEKYETDLEKKEKKKMFYYVLRKIGLR